jgi:hypothetical protein
MSYFLKNGNTFRVSNKEAMDLHDKLPAGNYVIKMDRQENLFLEEIEPFKVTGKIYGDTLRHTQRILFTFAARASSTGVMLNGEKGSGKTLLAKNIAVEGAKAEIPTIVINAPWHGDKFNSLIQMIEQPCIILFDEFEKVYDKDEQEAILTLLDGVYPSKKLFILTCNDKWRVDDHMRNRPGRIFYMLDFKGLDVDFIREYCEDNLDAKEHIDQICKISGMFDQFNFDMLKALVEEMNRFKETPQESLRMLNAKPEFGGDLRYDVKLSLNGLVIPKADLDPETWSGNPLNKMSLHIEYKVHTKDTDGEPDYDWKSISFATTDLKNIDSSGDSFTYENSKGYRLDLVKAKEFKPNYWDAF